MCAKGFVAVHMCSHLRLLTRMYVCMYVNSIAAPDEYAPTKRTSADPLLRDSYNSYTHTDAYSGAVINGG